MQVAQRTCVLIYPYWNVNFASVLELCCEGDSFNLSILECKWHSGATDAVLGSGFNLSILECKSCWLILFYMRDRRFNLSILECKFCGAARL